MKILRLLLSLAVLVGWLGCEMHPAPKSGSNGEETSPGSGKREPEPETVNPEPPSFFPAPKSG